MCIMMEFCKWTKSVPFDPPRERAAILTRVRSLRLLWEGKRPPWALFWHRIRLRSLSSPAARMSVRVGTSCMCPRAARHPSAGVFAGSLRAGFSTTPSSFVGSAGSNGAGSGVLSPPRRTGAMLLSHRATVVRWLAPSLARVFPPRSLAHLVRVRHLCMPTRACGSRLPWTQAMCCGAASGA